MKSYALTLRRVTPQAVLAFAAGLLFVRVFLAILWEYRWYFPPNFEATFLIGREATFYGLYACAFYVHIVASPVALALAAFLMFSGTRPGQGRRHRLAGKALLAVVFVAVTPSGLVMATQALTGPVAGAGFAVLALATAGTVAAAAWYASRRQFATHQKWATRCFLLLVSPLILRIVSGFLIVSGWESDWAYRANAWASWLVPLVVYETWRVIWSTRQVTFARPSDLKSGPRRRQEEQNLRAG